MKKLTFAIIILMGISFSACDFIGEKIPLFKRGDTLEAYQHRMDSIKYADSIRKVKKLEQENMLKEKARLEAERKAKELAILNAKNRYHVIAGSFKTPKYAETYLGEMQKQGYTVKTLKNEYGFDCVSIFATSSYGKALKKINELKVGQEEEDGEVELWVLEDK